MSREWTDAEEWRCDGVTWWRRISVVAMVLSIAIVIAGGAPAAPTVTDVRLGQHDDMTRLVLDMTEWADFAVFTLAAPDRVVIDMPPVRWALRERTLSVDRAGVARVPLRSVSSGSLMHEAPVNAHVALGGPGMADTGGNIVCRRSNVHKRFVRIPPA